MQTAKQYTKEHLEAAAEGLIAGPTIATCRLYIGEAFAESEEAVHIVLDASENIFQSAANLYGKPVRFVCEATGDDRTWLPEGGA